MFTIVSPMDPNRLEQFKNTKEVYDTFPQVKEFLIPTRSAPEIEKYLTEHGLMKDVRIIPYEHERGFNPSKALNLGVKHAKYDNIIITSPEVKPSTDVLAQLSESLDKNVVCQVFDQDADGNLSVLVCQGYRDESPYLYFLAMYRKADIEAINGWDEDFMLGYAYEDNDFGDRWVRAGLPFEIRDDIQAVHQYHPRSETIPGGLSVNLEKFNSNRDHKVIRPANGLIKEAD